MKNSTAVTLVAAFVLANSIIGTATEEPVRFILNKSDVTVSYRNGATRRATIDLPNQKNVDVIVDVPGLPSNQLSRIYQQSATNETITSFQMKPGQCYQATMYRDGFGNQHISDITTCHPG